jgi:hypothetical protein
MMCESSCFLLLGANGICQTKFRRFIVETNLAPTAFSQTFGRVYHQISIVLSGIDQPLKIIHLANVIPTLFLTSNGAEYDK